MLIEDTEGLHRKNIQNLIDLYGVQREPEIRTLYDQQRRELESKATIHDHLPFFTYQQTERILIQSYGKPIKIPKTIPIELQESIQPEQTHAKRRSLIKGLLGRLGL